MSASKKCTLKVMFTHISDINRNGKIDLPDAVKVSEPGFTGL